MNENTNIETVRYHEIPPGLYAFLSGVLLYVLYYLNGA